jgi:hypothetical protein
MSAYRIKRHDLLPVVQGTCSDANGPVDLTNATSVVFNLTLVGGSTPKVNRATAAFVDKPNGVVSYSWAGTDTDTSGSYNGEFEVGWPSSKPETFPNRGYINVVVYDDLA